MRRQRRKREEASEATSGELNIVPFLDIVVNVMMFLLATTTAALAVAQVEVEPPRTCVGCPGRTRGLSLGVMLAADGIIVSGADGVVAPGCEATGGGMTIPNRRGAYDFAALSACLERVHARFPHEDTMILSADPHVPYEHVVGAMDAGRASFPRVMLSAGVR